MTCHNHNDKPLMTRTALTLTELIGVIREICGFIGCEIWTLLVATFVIILMITTHCAIAQDVPPVLEFPEIGLDDTSTYRGYTTRFFQDSDGNTLQIYIKQNEGRVVNLWADAANESISFSARDNFGEPASLTWGSPAAKLSTAGMVRYVECSMSSNVRELELGHFVLNTMRLERDFQYFKKHLQPFDAEPFISSELSELIDSLQRLPESVRARHLALLKAQSLEELQLRLTPKIKQLSESQVVVEQPTFDGKNRLSLEFSIDVSRASMDVSKNKVSIHSRKNDPLKLSVKIGTDSPSLTPLKSADIFNSDFFEFYERKKSKRMQRQVKGMELLSSQEKLMAGVPNYATYFGRDMMMSALMLEPVLKPAMLEHVISSVLKKLTSGGEVSHEEGLGGQAIRENAAKYDKLISDYFEMKSQGHDTDANNVLADAEKLLGNLQAITENYNMVDDDFQLPVVAARYLTSSGIADERKRQFLRSAISVNDEITRLTLLLRNLLYVAKVSRPYVENSIPDNLISFRKLDNHRWHAGSWRDSAVGYANGRYAMDINAIWVPTALESVEKIFATLRRLGVSLNDLNAVAPEFEKSKLLEYSQKPDKLQRAVQIWRGAVRHFEVRLSAHEVERRVGAKLHWLPEQERKYWQGVLAESQAHKKNVEFLAISLNEASHPIPVAHTDIATWLFLENLTTKILQGEVESEDVLKRLQMFIVPYPVGLFIDGVGPVVANDVYASSEVWENFDRDLYHSPRVVWGREVNLLLLGLAKQILAAYDDDGRIRDQKIVPYVQKLQFILNKIVDAVAASGLKHNELWSYRIKDGRLVPARYATTTDIQLWNLTDLAVQFLLDRMRGH